MSARDSTEVLPRELAVDVLAALVVALLVVCGASVWLPAGRGGVDHLLLPAVAFPLIWVALALALFAGPHRRRARVVVGGLALLSIVTLALELLG
jgi:hypothetical protein